MSDRFETIEDYAVRRKGLSRDEFIRRYPHPFLVEREHEDALGASQPPSSTMVVSQDRLKAILSGEASAGASTPVLKVAAKGTPVAASRITVGRTRNNDIAIEAPSISKLHACFTIDAAKGVCSVIDENATNGTFVNGKRLAGGASVALRDGDMVAFSQQRKFTYYTPGGFFDYLSVADRTGPAR